MELKFNKSIDQKHKVKLDPVLISSEWRVGVAYGDQSASFEVRTALVGRDAPVKCTGKSSNGVDLGKVNGKIRNNIFIGKFDIPADIELGDNVYFEVELPRNSLRGESNYIPARPPVEVVNMRWGKQEARRGDIIDITADIRNVPSETDVMVSIYEYDADELHDIIIKIPTKVKNSKIDLKWEYQYYEDTDDIPTDEEMRRYGRSYNPPEYFFTVIIGEKEFGLPQKSGLLKFKDWLDINLANYTGVETYSITLPDGTTRSGGFDSNGKTRVEGIPPGRVTINIEGGN